MYEEEVAKKEVQLLALKDKLEFEQKEKERIDSEKFTEKELHEI